ncbi:hypothetical protein SAMN04515666_101362 [Bosea lupini]|uniref:Uncharacterized protein n=1 Tax=Bosea lupini TaxID=1036779 RepID=A0A1H7GI11_9HYPH|nr:hypothetical protein [Bosea lupini]SEK37751.1 hypothetical protein SAMN04515666_101362 [Bosea lupini]
MSLRAGIYLAGLGVIFLALWWLVDVASQNKVSQATETYNQENRDVADAASAARARVRDCYARGMLWDRTAGQCVRAVPSARE